METPNAAEGNSRRVMRVALPVELVRQMDSVITSGVGEYRTRTELIEDAVRQQVELLLIQGDGIENVTDQDPPRAAPRAGTPGTASVGYSATALVRATTAAVVPLGEAIGVPEDETLFGLHNRDYPSLWAAAFLRQQTQGSPVPLERYLDSVVAEAWKHARVLLELQETTGAKATALFPTNPAKRKSAESAFRQFAIGGLRSRAADGEVTTFGPLFVWRIATLTGNPARPDVGLTPQGEQLLGLLEGLTVEEPHPAHLARAFLRFLRENASEDHRGFVHLLRAVGDQGCNRQQLVAQMATTWPNWRDSELSTNTAGYVARAREWGLLRPRLQQGQYHLTDAGAQYLAISRSDSKDGETL